MKCNSLVWILGVSLTLLVTDPVASQNAVPGNAESDSQPQAEQPQSEQPEAEQPEAEQPLNPRGRYRERSTNVSSRYYIWVDSRGEWHVRTASRNGRIQRFHGTIAVKHGEIDTVSTVGLESSGDGADTFNPDQGGRIAFSIYTGGSFDGFDFTVTGDDDALIYFELYQTKREAKYPDRVYVGSSGRHPTDVYFSLRADGRPYEYPEPEASAETEADAAEEAAAEEAASPGAENP